MTVFNTDNDNEKGFATFEAMAVMLIFILIMTYSLGSFGIIHSAILQSISSRSYIFEQFRHRANINYFRNNPSAVGSGIAHTFYYKKGTRVARVVNEDPALPNDDRFFPSERWLAMGLSSDIEVVGRDLQTHEDKIPKMPTTPKPNKTVGVNPVWIHTTLGICIDANCGD